MNRLRLLAYALILPAAACSSNSTSTTAPTTTPTVYTVEYSGTLAQNRADTYTFVVQASGTVKATILSLAPDSTVLVGFGIGVWDGTACDASPGVWQDKATQGSSITGTVTSAPTALCLRIYDSQGTLVDSTDYNVQVSHP